MEMFEYIMKLIIEDYDTDVLAKAKVIQEFSALYYGSRITPSLEYPKIFDPMQMSMDEFREEQEKAFVDYQDEKEKDEEEFKVPDKLPKIVEQEPEDEEEEDENEFLS